MVAAIIDRVGAMVLPQWAQPLRMVPMATTATTIAAITTATDNTFVRDNIRIGIDTTEVQGGGLWPPSSLRFGQGANSSATVANCPSN
jgi:hypothetical protein